MSRVRRGPKARRRRKKILREAKGYRGGQSRLFRTATEKVNRALQFATRDRKVKKRDFRSLWITRIGIAAKLNGLNYSRFMSGLKKADVNLNRKILAELAVREPSAFSQLVEMAKAKLAA